LTQVKLVLYNREFKNLFDGLPYHFTSSKRCSLDKCKRIYIFTVYMPCTA